MTQAPPSHTALVLSAQSATVEAFESLYRQHVARSTVCACACCATPSAAEELTQEVFVRAWEKLASFRGASAFATWLYRLGGERGARSPACSGTVGPTIRRRRRFRARASGAARRSGRRHRPRAGRRRPATGRATRIPALSSGGAIATPSSPSSSVSPKARRRPTFTMRENSCERTSDDDLRRHPASARELSSTTTSRPRIARRVTSHLGTCLSCQPGSERTTRPRRGGPASRSCRSSPSAISGLASRDDSKQRSRPIESGRPHHPLVARGSRFDRRGFRHRPDRSASR